MRRAARKFIAFAVIWSLLIGLALPLLVARQPFDADAHEGVPVLGGTESPIVAEPGADAATGHCLICHWSSALKTVVVSARMSAAAPVVVPSPVAPALNDTPACVIADAPSSRGPPAVS